MDILYGHDRKLGDMDEPCMSDILENDMFHSTNMEPDAYMDNDWFNSLFDDPVLNDRMITDAAQPPCIKSEHSYSINDNSNDDLNVSDDIGTDIFGTCSSNANDISFKHENESITFKTEPVQEKDPLLVPVSMAAVTCQPTIILAPQSQQTLVDTTPDYSQICIKQEPVDVSEDSIDMSPSAISYDPVNLPPTPPSSASSDSEGSLSPQRSAPSSPIRQTPNRHHHQTITTSESKTFTQPLFLNPIPQSGVLLLSEEEKRTLISEGYPIPGKLPLTKQEEKNLKKIRRKIKNKISAQESRRKKKEYLETLEKRVEAYNQENTELKRKMDSLENNNRSLLSQLHKLQALVGKTSATQTGTVLMVLVLCFAVFLGGWSSTSLNVGYSLGPHVPSFLAKPSVVVPSPAMKPSIARAQVDDYSTPNLKSRVLMSLKDENEDGVEDSIPSVLWERQIWCAANEDISKLADREVRPESDKDFQVQELRDGANLGPSAPNVVTMTKEVEIGKKNETATYNQDYQATMHPDIAVAPGDILSVKAGGNLTVDIETA
ncbi:cyclic AMP-responsive element-binding protein 3-like protein 2 isoform X2 [Patella vulgata]|uniref:cyclic AMP-responsive element-binding protein 3-like protein 2 isoform X2 n=1 Tax=Patella vulgata TaxID=6465 RepID=UPI00217F3955|nr:cyclic AMP-responsive element-binding protein 3-like protein 2 isoform X2 [Patella vulgata]